MAEKQNKNMIIGVAVAVVALVAIIVGVLIMKGNGDDSIGDGTGDETDIQQVESTTSGFEEPDVVVGYGDYDVMYAQSKAIQNGEMEGMVIQIDGVVSHPRSKYSIGESGEGSTFIGTEFEIDGGSDADYPSDGDHVIITGEVIQKSPMYFIIRTMPEYVEVIERAEDIEEVEEAEEAEEEL